MLELRDFPPRRVGDAQDLKVWHCSAEEGGDLPGARCLNAKILEVLGRAFQSSDNDIWRVVGYNRRDSIDTLCEPVQ